MTLEPRVYPGTTRPLEIGNPKVAFIDVGLDGVFRALADPVRRQLLDQLHARNGQTLGELCRKHDMTRQAVMKHLAVLEEAQLVVTQKRGREKLHYLNPVPIQEIADRWIGKFERSRLRVLADLKKRLEDVAYEGEFTTGKPARSRRS